MVEISQLPCEVGDVYAVRVLGVLGMIDEGEMDWKLVCINAADPLAAELPGTHAQHTHPPTIFCTPHSCVISPQPHRVTATPDWCWVDCAPAHRRDGPGVPG